MKEKECFKKNNKLIRNFLHYMSILIEKFYDVRGPKEFIGAAGNRSVSDGESYIVAVN